jgi:hypothetical protein
MAIAKKARERSVIVYDTKERISDTRRLCNLTSLFPRIFASSFEISNPIEDVDTAEG